MIKIIRTSILAFFTVSILLLSSCSQDDSVIMSPVVKPDIIFFEISASNQLIKYNANASQNVAAQFTVSGLQVSETILAIDFRPATGQLYGLGSTSRIYVIIQETGAARAIGAAPFTPA
jgi:ABC-type multidrug transport system permease subunit